MTDMLLDGEFLARLGTIIVIDLLLAGDNALVIALAVRSLPQRQQLYGRIFGTMGAVVLRIGLITVTTILLGMPFLKLVGGLLLIWIAVKLVRPDADDGAHIRQGTSLKGAIWIIMVADLVMSLDNVLGVAAAAAGDMKLVVLGIAISIPIVVWGSGILARLMSRFTWIVWIGGGVLGYVAGEMALSDNAVRPWVGEGVHRVVPFLLALLLTALGWWLARRPREESGDPAVARD
jgi:YjbE family integral membrane protein